MMVAGEHSIIGRGNQMDVYSNYLDQKGIASFILELLPLLTGDFSLVGFGDGEARGAFWSNNVVALGAAIVIEFLWVLFSIVCNHVALIRIDGPALGAARLVLAEVIVEVAFGLTHVLARLFATLAATLKPILHPSIGSEASVRTAKLSSQCFVALCGRFDDTNGLENSFAGPALAHVGEMSTFGRLWLMQGEGCISISE